MDPYRRRPKPEPDMKPDPDPKPVCQHQCGGVYTDDQRLAQITCPCGYGYYDKEQHKFIPGSLVRRGIAPTREEYVDHVRRCKNRQYGAPLVGQIFLGATTSPAPQNDRQKDTETYSHRPLLVDELLPYRQQFADPDQVIPTSSFRRHQRASAERGTEKPQFASIDRGPPAYSISRHQHASAERAAPLNAAMGPKGRMPVEIKQKEKYIIAKGLIEEDALEYYLKSILGKDVEIEETDDEYIIYGIRSISETDWREIEKDSREWTREASSNNDELLYKDSRVAKKRRQISSTAAAKPTRLVERDKPPLQRNTSSYNQEKTNRNPPLSSSPDSAYGASFHPSLAENLSVNPDDKFPPYTADDKFRPYTTDDRFRPYTTDDRFRPYRVESKAPKGSGIRSHFYEEENLYINLTKPEVSSPETPERQDRHGSPYQKGFPPRDSAASRQTVGGVESLRSDTKQSDTEATYTMTWSLDVGPVKHLLAQLPEAPSLRDAMVLYGSAQNALCGTWSDYLGLLIDDPKVFVDPVPFLDGLESAIRSKDLVAEVILRPSSETRCNCQFRNDPHAQTWDDKILISLETNVQRFYVIVENWLGGIAAALRKASGPYPIVSSIDQQVYTPIEPRRVHKIPADGCWGRLFPGKIIAAAPVKHPFEMKGLELDFNLMCQLCGIDTPVSLDGGLCLAGVYTILLPMGESYDKEGATCLQWHLISVQPSEDSVYQCREKLWQLWSKHRPEEWYRTEKLDVLRCFKRHFLGWCGKSNITLGTENQTYDLKYSAAPPRDREECDRSTTFNMSFVLNGVGLGASRTIRFAPTERSPFENKTQSLTSWLDSAILEQIILYCPSRKQAWLVPKISLILHLVIAHMKDMQHRHPELAFNLPYCQDSATAENAFRTLCDHLDDPIPERDLAGNCRLKHLVTTYLYCLDGVRRSTRSQRFSQAFYGYEAADILRQSPYFRLKAGNASNQILQLGSLGGWTRLLEAVYVVLFVEGINDPIVPHSLAIGNGDLTCAGLRTMPEQRNLMAATTASLKCLWSHTSYGSWHRLSKNAYCHCPGEVFGPCSCQRGVVACQRMQMIWPNKNAKKPEDIELENNPQGAVIFISGAGLREGIATQRCGM